jgi:hypothetical protein
MPKNGRACARNVEQMKTHACPRDSATGHLTNRAAMRQYCGASHGNFHHIIFARQLLPISESCMTRRRVCRALIPRQQDFARLPPAFRKYARTNRRPAIFGTHCTAHGSERSKRANIDTLATKMTI